jgi:hypothetical protein
VSDAETEELGKGSTEDGPAASGPSPYRKPALAVLRAVVVLAIAAVGYVEIIPINHPAVHHPEVTKAVRTRLAELAPKESGIAGFKTKATSAGEVPAANAQVTVYEALAKKYPDQTGIYSIYWQGTAKGSSDQVGVVAFLLPTDADASTVLGALNKLELGAKSQSASSLKRAKAFTMPGLAGSQGSIFAPAKATKTPADLVLASYRQGNVVVFVNTVRGGEDSAVGALAQAQATALSQSESKLLAKVEPGFTLVDVTAKAYTTPSFTHYPQVASIVWVAGGVVVALLAGVGPWWVARARRRRQERLQAELNRLIVVRGQTITKYRR